MGRSMVVLAVISVISTMPVTGARTTAVKSAAVPTTAKLRGSNPRSGSKRSQSETEGEAEMRA